MPKENLPVVQNHNLPTLPVIIDQHGKVLSGTPITIQAVTQQHDDGFWHAAQEWQGLEAGGLAILAAVIGAWVLNRQTTQNKRLDEARLQRELRARRAVLPLTLSNLAEWAESCGSLLLTSYQKRGSGSTTALASMPQIPAETIPQLERFVEASSDEAAESVANLLGDIQIFSARMRGAGYMSGAKSPKMPVASDLESHLLGIGTISAHIASLFDYSRRRSEVVGAQPSWDEVRTALKLIGADPHTDPGLFKRLDGRESTDKAPGYLALH